MEVIAAIIIISLDPSETITDQQYQEQEDAENIGGGAGVATGVAVGLLYYVTLNAYGGTLGKRAFGMRLRDAKSGANIGVGRSVMRVIVSVVSGLALALGYLWCIWDDDKQTWHDKAAGSVVVKT